MFSADIKIKKSHPPYHQFIMKYLILSIAFFYSSLLYSQIVDNATHEGQDYRVSKCLPESLHSKLKEKLFISRDSLVNLGAIPDANFRKSDPDDHILLDWPVSQNSNFEDVGYYAISNFVDHSATYPDAVQDYNCGVRSYDLPSGYNHAGTDIFSSPFPWMKMNNDQVIVVAAAAGYVIYKEESKYDKNCDFNNDGQWNAVYIGHDDGSLAWYGHLKQNSLTNIPVGERIEAGEYIGVMGSSGFSTGPHLHFELYDATNQLVDPFAGDCNPTTSGSWWKTQKSYTEPQLLKIMTHSIPPVPYGCYEDEKYNKRTNFSNGQTVYLTSYYRDQSIGDIAYHRLIAPDSSVFEQWEKEFEQNYASSYWYWQMNVTSTLDRGRWSYEIVYENHETQRHFFYITSSNDSAEIVTNNRIYVNNSTEDFVISLKNAGNIGLDIQNIEFSDALSGQWYGTIEPDGEKQLHIEVDTTIIASAETITIYSIDNAPFIIDVLNEDQVFASISTDKSILEFGELVINSADSIALKISNEGLADLEITEMVYTNGFDGPMESLTVKSMGDTVIYFYFKPIEVVTYEEKIKIYSNANDQAILILSVNGKGIPQPILADKKENLPIYTIYPNPIDNYLIIQYNRLINRPNEIKIIDSKGKNIINEKKLKGPSDSHLKLNTSNLQRGVYILLINDNTSSLTSFKFIKN
jgi:murein DD-endopeptidase MepM/ murein hydrolase activator NlpD